MTNEELAIRIKAGEKELIPQLWQQVEKFIAMKAGKYYTAKTDGKAKAVSFEIEDLVQSGYMALISAIDYYGEAVECGFLTYLSYTLKTSFAETAGTRTSLMRNDGLQNATSLDAPIGDEYDSTLHDRVADAATTGDGSVEAQSVSRIFQGELHDALERSIELLSEKQKEVIRLRYYEDLSSMQTARRLNCTRSNVSGVERDALSTMYRNCERTGLEQYLDDKTNFYLRVSQSEAVWTSSVETLVLKREKWRESWLKLNEEGDFDG